MACISCGAVEGLHSGLESAYLAMWQATGPAVMALASALIAIQIAWDIIQLFKGDGDAGIAVTETRDRLVWMGIVITLMTNPDVLWDYLFTFFLNIGPYLGIQVLDNFTDTPTFDFGITGFLAIIEDSFFTSVIKMVMRSLDGMYIFTTGAIEVLTVLIIVIVYGIFLYKIILSSVQSLVQIYIVGFFAVFWMAALAFPQTRTVFFHALRIMFTASLQLLAVAGAITIILAGMADAFPELSDPDNTALTTNVASEQWFTLLLTGIFMVFVVDIALSLPGLVMQTFLSGVATAATTQGVAGRIARTALTFATGGGSGVAGRLLSGAAGKR